MKKHIWNSVVIVFGSFLFALAINLFVIPSELSEGGVTGLTIIFYYLFEWSPGLVSFILNGILLVVGYKFLNKQTVIYTIIAVVSISLSLHFTEGFGIDSDEVLVNAIFAGILTGAGIGMIIRVGGTTAGTTILAKMTNKFLGWNISYSLLFFDIIVVLSSYFVIGAEKVMITLIMLYVATKVMELIIEGLNPKKAVTIISKESDAIAQQINQKLDRGVTVMNGRGYYTKEAKEVLYIVISKQEIMKLKKIVLATDHTAFVAIHDVRDVFGEGFGDMSKG